MEQHPPRESEKWKESPYHLQELCHTMTSSCTLAFTVYMLICSTAEKKKQPSKQTKFKNFNNQILLRVPLTFFESPLNGQFKDRVFFFFYSQILSDISFPKTPFATAALNPKSTDLKSVQYSTLRGLHLQKKFPLK